jgi:hypothetical protein
MKRKMFTVIFILSLVMTLFSTAAANRGISFDAIYQVPGKGYVATFDVRGEWQQDELWGFVSLPHNRQIDMNCNFRDDGKVACNIADGISQYASRMVKLVVYGYPFDVVVPPDVRRGASFESIRHVQGKGYVAIFRIWGRWTKADLWGFVVLPHNRQINMSCNFIEDDSKVSCTIADGISQWAKKTLKIVLYGYTFPVTIPGKLP